MENNKENAKNSGAEFSKDEDFNWEADTSKANVSDGLKKLITNGLSAVMMSEDIVRQYLQDVKIPKDLVGNVIKGIGKSREEIVSRAGSEIGKLIEKIDVVEELTKFLRENKIEVSAEVEFTKKDSRNSKANETKES